MAFRAGLKRTKKSGIYNQIFWIGLMEKTQRFPGMRTMVCFILLSVLFLGPSTKIYSQQGPTVVLLLVDSTLSTQLGTSYTTFKKDLANDGYVVSEEIINSNTEPPEIRQLIQRYYSSPINLNGVILIGNLKAPYAIIKYGDYSNPNALKLWVSLDASDMYYGDMDGEWDHLTADEFKDIVDNPPSNVTELYKEVSCSSCINEYIVDFDKENVWNYSSVQNKSQYGIEIWVSRIMGHNLSISDKTEIDILDDYFNWNHTFRTGAHLIPETCYMLNATESPGPNDQGMDFTTIFDDIITASDLSKQEYLPYLQEELGSKLFYATIHSCPGWHQFSDGALLTTNELLKIEKTGVFYMLNCCSGCRWDQSEPFPNYLGGVYVFDKSDEGGGYGIAAMGFTGVGGFNNLNYFTDCYYDNPFANYGEMYVYWFNKNLQINFSPMNYVCLGDLTISPDTPIGGASVSERPLLSGEYYLSQNYPNPFNLSTSMSFTIPNRCAISLKIYNVLGEEVASLINGKMMDAGRHSITWDASSLTSGIYFYRFEAAGQYSTIKRCVLMK